VVNCSDFEFDENETAHISCIDNENDALRLPEQEQIYTEEQVVETGQTGQVASEVHQQKNEKLRYIAFFRSETQILNFLSRCFS